MPALMAVGIGIAFNNAIAAVEGFFGKTGEFVANAEVRRGGRSEWNLAQAAGGLST